MTDLLAGRGTFEHLSIDVRKELLKGAITAINDYALAGICVMFDATRAHVGGKMSRTVRTLAPEIVTLTVAGDDRYDIQILTGTKLRVLLQEQQEEMERPELKTVVPPHTRRFRLVSAAQLAAMGKRMQACSTAKQRAQNMKGKQTRDLKAWSDLAWQRKLSKTLTVSRVDENIPGVKLKGKRKPWYIALTQKPDMLTEVGGVRSLPDGKILLLTEDEIVALVRYLVEPQTVVWSDNPEPTEAGECQVVCFIQPGMVATSDAGEVVNGEASWSPEYFKQQEAHDIMKDGRTPKMHTLPWKLEPLVGRKAAEGTTPKRKRKRKRKK
jgi:hypothetical protein